MTTTFEELCLRAFVASAATAVWKLHIKPFNMAIDEYNVYVKPDEYLAEYARHESIGVITQELVHA